MKINRLSKEVVKDLQKIIGGRIVSIHTERGQIKYGDSLEIKGSGMISIIVRKPEIKKYFKLRLKFHEDKEGIFYTEFYKWDNTYSKEKAKGKRERVTNFDKEWIEDYEKYNVSFQLAAKKENRKIFRQSDKIKSIKIYHYVAKYERDSNYNYLALIDFETETGRRLVIEEDDQMHHFYLHIDNFENLNYRLNEIHDDEGETFGEKRYKLKHEIN